MIAKKMKGLTLFFFFIGIFWMSELGAQVLPPAFNCVKGDTLFWELPEPTCGDFIALDIFFAEEREGPYTLLSSVVDETQVQFVHTVFLPNRFYYLVSRYDCADGVSPPSDTLDNRPPQTVRLNFITVEDGGVRLDWEPSVSPQTRAYIIYRVSSQGTIPIDTLFDGLSFFDPNSNPNQRIEFYYVLAMDACETRGGFDVAHNTIFLEVSQDPCTRAATLTWNEYNFWPDGYEEWEIFVSEDGGDFVLAGSVEADSTRFIFEGLRDGVTYCFRVEVSESGRPTNRSASNEVCILADVVEPVQYLCWFSVHSFMNDAVLLNYNISPGANLEYLRILRGRNPSNLNEEIHRLELPFFVASGGSFTDDFGSPALIRYYYQIETRDLCGDIVLSPVISNFPISGELLPGRQNRLSWEAPFLEEGTLLSYSIRRFEGNQSEGVGDVEPMDREFIDRIEGPATGNNVFCYQILATSSNECEGEADFTTQLSPLICVEQNSSILMPNAFVVGGVNDVVRPVILYPESIETYQIRIFDRFGAVVFESNDPQFGWDGRKNGQALPLGVYHYYIRARQNSGRVIEETGPVTLIR